jgi:predicted lipid-binding transport protein (Tim44 family)
LQSEFFLGLFIEDNLAKTLKWNVLMMKYFKKLAPFFMLLIAFSLVEGGLNADYADARSKFGGRSFKMSPRKAPAKTTQGTRTQNKSSFGRGLAGGLLGGALGGMLFGSMFGAGGEGMGILPILLLAGGAYYFFRKMKRPNQNTNSSYNQNPGQQGMGSVFGGGTGTGGSGSHPIPEYQDPVEEGLGQIRENDRKFEKDYFVEIASDVFFQIQAGWMRRDLDSYRHLLGGQLAGEYEGHFAEMYQKGYINKLESIAVRNVKIIAAGSDGMEDFVTVLFSANLLDYTVDDKNGELIDGSMTTPVKFDEKWTWARPAGTEQWKLEGIEK